MLTTGLISITGDRRWRGVPLLEGHRHGQEQRRRGEAGGGAWTYFTLVRGGVCTVCACLRMSYGDLFFFVLKYNFTVYYEVKLK